MIDRNKITKLETHKRVKELRKCESFGYLADMLQEHIHTLALITKETPRETKS